MQSTDAQWLVSVCQVVGDPSYFPDKVRRTSKVVRAMCLLSHPIPNTNNAPSAQIILPQRQVGQSHLAHSPCFHFYIVPYFAFVFSLISICLQLHGLYVLTRLTRW